MSDTVNFSGDFRGAIVNFKSTLTNVQQTVQSLPSMDDTAKKELERMIGELSQALEGLPSDKSELAQAMAQQMEGLVAEAKKEEPNKTLLNISADGLKRAAQTVADVTPNILKVATQIADFFSKLGGS